MGVATKATKHAGGLYRKTFDAVLRPVRKIESEAAHLHKVEQVGESAETPFIAIMGVVLFLVPIFALMLGLALAAYYLARR
jgi:nitrogen fixation/metabolism regulation signal transduction histidine kinase